MRYIWNRYFLGVITLFILIYLSLKLILPSFIRKELVKGLGHFTLMAVSIEEIKFEPIGLKLILRSLKIGPNLRAGEIYGTVSLYKLLSKQVIVSHFSLTDANLQLDKNFKLIGFDLNKDKAAAKINQKEEGHLPGTDWKIGIKEVEVKQVNITLVNENNLLIKNLNILNLNLYKTMTPVNINGLLQFNKSPVSITGEAQHYLSTPKYELNIGLKELSLSALNEVLPQLGMIEGSLNLNSIIKGQGQEIQAIVNLEGSNLAIYSTDKKTVDYYLKDLMIDKLSLNLQKEITLTANLIETNNFILGAKTESHRKRKYLSKFANIKITNLNLKKSGIPFDLQADYNDTGKIHISQKGTEEKKTLKVKIMALDLVPLSETFEETLSYQVESGKLNMELTTQTLKNSVKGLVLVKLDQLRLDDRNENNQKLESKAGFPLSTAISMIRNDEGSIEVELPISGSDKDPDFGFLPILRKGIASIVMPKLGAMIASKAALKFIPMLISSVPFSPANTFVLVKGGYRLLTKPRFKDIEFLPMEDEIKEESKAQLNQLATFLKKNTKISFNICPEASVYEARNAEKDKPLDKEVVLDLAKRRMAKVTAYLSKKNLSSKQTIFCRPKTSENEQKFGRVIISL